MNCADKRQKLNGAHSVSKSTAEANPQESSDSSDMSDLMTGATMESSFQKDKKLIFFCKFMIAYPSGVCYTLGEMD